MTHASKLTEADCAAIRAECIPHDPLRSIAALARRYRVAKSWVFMIVHGRGRDGAYKYTPVAVETVKQIREAYAAGEGGYMRLALRFGSSPSNVRKIVRGLTWRHLT
jgi:Mor family transcriptional regulator